MSTINTCSAVVHTTSVRCKKIREKDSKYCLYHSKMLVDTLSKKKPIKSRLFNIDNIINKRSCKHTLQDVLQDKKSTIEELKASLKPLQYVFETKHIAIDNAEHEDMNIKDTHYKYTTYYKSIVIKKTKNAIYNSISISPSIITIFLNTFNGIIEYLSKYLKDKKYFIEFTYVRDLVINNTNNSRDILVKCSILLYNTLAKEYSIYGITHEDEQENIMLSITHIFLLVSIYYYTIFISEDPDHIVNTHCLVNSSILGHTIDRKQLRILKEVLTKMYIEIAKSDEPVLSLIRSNIVRMFSYGY